MAQASESQHNRNNVPSLRSPAVGDFFLVGVSYLASWCYSGRKRHTRQYWLTATLVHIGIYELTIHWHDTRGKIRGNRLICMHLKNNR